MNARSRLRTAFDPSASKAEARHRAEALKERVYVTFTSLAVIIAFARDADHGTVTGAALTLLLTVLGTLTAVFVADVIAHMVRESSLPSRSEFKHLLYVSFGSLAVIVAPLIILGLCAGGLVELAFALRLISFVLMATLVIVTLFAVGRLKIRIGPKIMILAIMSALSLAALAIELLAH